MVRRLVAKPKHWNRTGRELWNPGTPSAVGLKSRVNNGISSLNSDVPVRTILPPHFHYFVKAKLFVVSTISAS